MEANEFAVKLKASGSKTDLTDLLNVHDDFKSLVPKLSVKDRGSFAVNVLCILCRNLDKVPSWRATVSSKDLVSLSVDCVRETRALGPADRVKTLACVYHIHKHVVKQDSTEAPELILKLSYMPFECEAENLLKEYIKTYWNILVDRIMYIEKLKAGKRAIIKLLPKLVEDTEKIIHLYDTAQFCSNILIFLVKKLYFLYSDHYAKQVNDAYKAIFEAISKKSDLKKFKTLSDKDVFDLYTKLSEAFYVVAENSAKIAFKDSTLPIAVRLSISLLGHKSDIYHCLQTFYLNAFCYLMKEQLDLNFTETVLRGMVHSCESTERLGYEKAMTASYPYIYQMLRLFIEFSVLNSDKRRWSKHFNIECQENCLKLMMLLMKKLRNTEQLLKCDNCNIKTGLHDSLRLSFSVKSFISISLSQELNVTTILPLYYELIQAQHNIMKELANLGCYNHLKCLKKAQTDIHNTAILLNKSSLYEYSIKTFDLYLKEEIKHYKNESDLKNISRGFYNKSICELDFKLYEQALQSAYLSFFFAQPEGLSSEKYISLVIDIKAKILKAKPEENLEDSQEIASQEHLQLTTVLNAFKNAIQSDFYGDLSPFLRPLKLSILLKHEFSMYAKLWPSILPIAGIWSCLLELYEGKHTDLHPTENQSEILWVLYEMIIQTPTVVRTIHSEYFSKIIFKLLENFEGKTPEELLVKCVMLVLKCEYDLADASAKYGWKSDQSVTDPDQISVRRTVEQESAALAAGVEAVEVLMRIEPELKKTRPSILNSSLQTLRSLAPLLLPHSRAPALQLARCCCALAASDVDTYLLNAGLLLSHSTRRSAQSQRLLAAGLRAVREMQAWTDTAFVFVCDAAIFQARCGRRAAAAQLVQCAQAKLLETLETNPEADLQLAIGRLLEAQLALLGPHASFAAVVAAQRHYLTVSNNATRWSTRRYRSLTIKLRIQATSLLAARRCRSVQLWRRARAAAAVKIDNRLKFILGLPTNESQSAILCQNTKPQHETPRPQLVDPMRDCVMFKKTQISPSLPCIQVPGFKMPEFLSHRGDCLCYACQTPSCFLLACQTAGLEASMYFRASELELARNYFDGVLKMFGLVELKLSLAKRELKAKNYEPFIIEIVDNELKEEFQQIQVDILIEAAFFELYMENKDKADDFIVRIHELMEEMRDPDSYLKSEVMNLTCASAQIRKTVKRHSLEITGLEKELESLKLTPTKNNEIEPPKTPEQKVIPDIKPSKIIVKGEEIPNAKRKVIKLNLDEVVEDPPANEIKKRTSKRSEFKIPVPITAKPVPETITPRPTRSKPSILLTQPSVESKSNVTQEISTPNAANTSKVHDSVFFTPKEVCATPVTDEFFTPMTSVKPYAKKSLRKDIIKNLEQEFSSAKLDASKTTDDKENTKTKTVNNKENTKVPVKSGIPKSKSRVSKVETGSLTALKDRRSVRRATSPGKLEGTTASAQTQPRSRRLVRNPVNFSLDEDKSTK
ncbi:uncharacterized protein LOC105398787 [Plutella xylostella]|uniref:uncharacterized protein LOC105398787 n=1 Tax=Plutella xylostella TaxID=51655 RepID=UPI002032C277|nr:uncharacterized protein LOC105398787 [Plutella xylostella]